MRIYTAEIAAHTGAATTVLYYATKGFSSAPSATPANTFFDERVRQPAFFKRSLFRPGTTKGTATIDYGDLILNNTDGALDFLRTYGLDGRVLIIRSGEEGTAYPGAFVTEFVGTMQRPVFNGRDVQIKVRGRQYELDRPLQTTKYLGTGTLEGDAAILGQPKPFILGQVFNQPAVLVNASKLIYQVHDGAVASIATVYDKGVALGGTLFAASGPAGAGSGNLAVSVDGVKWSVTPNPASSISGNCALNGVPGTLILGVTGGLSYSTDGTTWTKTTINASFICFSLAFDGTHYVALGSLSGTPAIYYSTSLASGWTASTHGFTGTSGAQSVCYDAVNSQFVAVGLAGQVGTSPTGATFTMQTSLGAFVNLTAIVMGASLLVAMSTGGGIYTSPTGVTWTSRTSPVTSGPNNVSMTYGNGLYVAGISLPGKVIYSPDGINWTVVVVPFTTATVISASFVASQFMLGGDNGFIIISPDAVNWLQVSTGYNPGVYRQINAIMYAQNLNGVVYANNTDLLDDTKSPNPGCVGICVSTGFFRVGSSPVGQVTCDATEGVAVGNRTSAQLFARLLTRAGYSAGAWSASDVTALDALDSSVLGYAMSNDATTYVEVLTLIAGSVGAAWWVDRTGVFRIRRIVAPFGTSVASFTENDLLKPPACVQVQDDGGGLPSFSTILQYAKNGAVQTGDALAGAVSLTRRAFVGLEYRSVLSTDAAVLTKHLQAVETNDDTLYTVQANAQTEATRQQTLRGVQRDRFDLTLPLTTETNTVDLCDVISFAHNQRFGLSAGQLFLVIGVEPNAMQRQVILSVWG